MQPDKFICFIHIEKCAGTSLNRLLHNNFPGYFNVFSREELCKNGVFTEKQFKFLKTMFPFISGMGGHSLRTYAGYEKHLKKDIFYFTFLRNPVERYLSHLNYQIHQMDIPWELEEFLENKEFSNYQTKRIAGGEELEKAKQILTNTYSFIGLVEYFELSLFILKEKLKLPLMNIHYNKANVANTKNIIRYNELTESMQDRIQHANKLDIELYDFAEREIFNKYDIQKHSGEIDGFRKENLIFQYNKLNQFLRKSKGVSVLYLFQPLSVWVS